ncbi:MAG: prolipoprotein diacylglyceryl transferase [Ruminococcus sp.]|nr:prolipoprotein diacylglyceryl transferase [Ruminococcus sp.]
MNDTYTNLNDNQIAFPNLGIELEADPTAFTLFGIDIQWYGLLITLGLLLAIVYCFSQMKRYGLNSDRALDAVLAGIVGGIVGARAYYVILEWERYADDPMSIFNLRQGGLAIYGGLIGAILVGGVVAKLRKVRLLPLLDLAGQGFLIGQCLGRWGNFFNQEAFGCNTDSLFGMTGGRIQNWISTAYINTECYGNLGVEIDPNLPVHPCFLYESVWCFAGFILLAVVSRKFRKFDGQIFLMYVAWYGLGRSFIEGLRTDSLVMGSIRVSQALAIVCVVVAVILLIVIGSKVKRMGVDYKLYAETEESRRLLREMEEQRTKSRQKKTETASSEEAVSGAADAETSDEAEDGNESEPESPVSDDTAVTEEMTEEIVNDADEMKEE